MSVRRAVFEWKGIEFLPVDHQLAEEKLCAQEGERPLDPDVVNAKALYQRWATYSEINPQQRWMLHLLSSCLKELEKKLGDISALAA